MGKQDVSRIRSLAGKWAQLASLPIMQERKKLWTDLHSLRPTRPMILVEPNEIFNYVEQRELQCQDEYLRNVEYLMLETIRHAEEVGDDVVVEPYLRIGWDMAFSDYGVDVQMISAEARDSSHLGYIFNCPVKTPEDVSKLVPRRMEINKGVSLKRREMLQEIMGGILDVRLANYDHFDTARPGYDAWAGLYFFGLTWQLHRFVGMDQMMYWYCDFPEAMHALLRYVTDDRKRLFTLLEKEGCVSPNTDNQKGGPNFYGYCDDLKAPGAASDGKLLDCWAWAESQESTGVSCAMFSEFVLPYMAELSRMFGLVYYGCCEPVHDKLEAIMAAIPNLRAVSVSGWNDFDVVGEMLGDQYIYSRKPVSPPISGASADWDAARADLERTKRSARAGYLEVLYRDIYDIHGDRRRLSEWVKLARGILE